MRKALLTVPASKPRTWQKNKSFPIWDLQKGPQFRGPFSVSGVALTQRQRKRDQDAIKLIVSGFCQEILAKLPMEFAVEARKLLAIELEGSVG